MQWSDEIDDVIGGDLVVALAYNTPAGGSVVTPVCPIGLRDRDAGRIGFTTSIGFGRKLQRIARDPGVALAFHTREHGMSSTPGFVLAQGRASVADLSPELIQRVTDQATKFLGPPKHGAFWDRWLSVYYTDRVVVWVDVDRITRRLPGAAPEVTGAPEAGPPAPQTPPKNGTGPRKSATATGKRVGALPHRLLGYKGGDGLPVIVEVDVLRADDHGVDLKPAVPLPEGGRRAGLLGHRFNEQVVGLAIEQRTGWLVVADGSVRYAPHTSHRLLLPHNKTVVLLANGLGAKVAKHQADRNAAKAAKAAQASA